MIRLATVLDLPQVAVAENRVREDKVSALCMLFRRLASPVSLADLQLLFGWEESRVFIGDRVGRIAYRDGLRPLNGRLPLLGWLNGPLAAWGRAAHALPAGSMTPWSSAALLWLDEG